MPHYTLYGLIVQSPLVFPDFPAEPLPAARVDIELEWVDSLPPLPAFHCQRRLDVESVPTLVVTRDDSAYHFAYSDGTAFLITRNGTQVLAAIAPEQTIEDTLTYFTGPIMAFCLALRGIFCLHASAVLIDDVAVAFVGPAGAGKSTTAAMLSRAGVAVISDDALPFHIRPDGVWVSASYPRLRLWGDSVKRLWGEKDALPMLTPNWDKRYLRLDSGSFAPGPHRLGLLVFLESSATASQSVFWAAMNSVYIQDLLPQELLRTQFEQMGTLLRNVCCVTMPVPGGAQECLTCLRSELEVATTT